MWVCYLKTHTPDEERSFIQLKKYVIIFAF